LDAENVIGLVKSPRLHQIYDMAKLCLTTRMDESICVVCDNLLPNIILALILPKRITFKAHEAKNTTSFKLPTNSFESLCTSTHMQDSSKYVIIN
jgi:hypothetical protein